MLLLIRRHDNLLLLLLLLLKKSIVLFSTSFGVVENDEVVIRLQLLYKLFALERISQF